MLAERRERRPVISWDVARIDVSILRKSDAQILSSEAVVEENLAEA